MDTGSIAIRKLYHNKWRVRLKLPKLWLAQFEGYQGLSLWGEAVNRQWGSPSLSDGREAPYRDKSTDYNTLAYAERAVAELIAEIDWLKARSHEAESTVWTLCLAYGTPTQQGHVTTTGTKKDEF